MTGAALTVLIAMLGFIVVSMAMYTAVLERTPEIGILKALGASFGYIPDLLFRETLVIALIATGLGIAMTYETQWLMMHAVPASLTQETAYKWWPIAGAISITGALLGADLSRMQRSETGCHPGIIV